MKKIAILLSIIFLLSSCFFGGKIEKQSFNIRNDNGVVKKIQKEEEYKKITSCVDIINGVKSINNKRILNISYNYIRIKSIYLKKNKQKKIELEKELNIIEGFVTKDCDVIKEDYGKKLCKIYVSGDYSKLDTFKFEGGENKKETILIFESLKQGTVLEGAKEKIITPILKWNDLGKNITFKFNNSEDIFRIDYYVYFKKNGKEKFLRELNKQFLDICKKLNNEN